MLDLHKYTVAPDKSLEMFVVPHRNLDGTFDDGRADQIYHSNCEEIANRRLRYVANLSDESQLMASGDSIGEEVVSHDGVVSDGGWWWYVIKIVEYKLG